MAILANDLDAPSHPRQQRNLAFNRVIAYDLDTESVAGSNMVLTAGKQPMSDSAHQHPTPVPAAITVRPAVLDDADAVYQLIAEAACTTSVLPRSRENVIQKIRNFFVLECEGRIIGCGALSLFTRTLAEIKSLVVAADWRGRGIGARLVAGLVDEAARLGVRRLFALTDSPRFFARCGFRPVSKATLPHKVWNECVFCPKFLNCQEEAMDMLLPTVVHVQPPPPEAGRP